MSKTAVDTSKNFISGVIDQSKTLTSNETEESTSKYENYFKNKVTVMTSLSILKNIFIILIIIGILKYKKSECKKTYILYAGSTLALIIINIFELYYNINCNKECKNNDFFIFNIVGLFIKTIFYIILCYLLYNCSSYITDPEPVNTDITVSE
jgi:hypothetical protein